jgi:hypothetical protein
LIGDAIGDMQASNKNHVLFYSINPGDEVKSWKRFYDEVFDKFIDGKYAGTYESKLIEDFDKCLPEKPYWLE